MNNAVVLGTTGLGCKHVGNVYVVAISSYATVGHLLPIVLNFESSIPSGKAVLGWTPVGGVRFFFSIINMLLVKNDDIVRIQKTGQSDCQFEFFCCPT